ncbi:hypothetical protein [Pedobacter gandavensis]|uniref:hypothetical protein n=1 Tax=Pedobacter gandavensis TaxID=2679963 RepID=UPI00292DAABF|nr:hypothetical protein [Pedobacter gandavensis]
MEFVGIMFALFFAIILTAFFSLVFKNTGPWAGFWTFFVLLFFVSLATGEWAAQRGPTAWGYYWAPGFIAAFLVGLLLASVSPNSDAKRTSKLKNRPEHSANEELRDFEVAVVTVVLGFFFWSLLVVLALLAIAGIVIKM